jgi:hypothetical protein
MRPAKAQALQITAIGPIERLKQRNAPMPKMSDQRRKAIQAKQRKATNAKTRVAKIAKKKRNAA